MPFAPHEIENKRFVVALRGYQTDEVEAFLRAVAADYQTAIEAARTAAAADAEELIRAAERDAADIREAARLEAEACFEEIERRAAALAAREIEIRTRLEQLDVAEELLGRPGTTVSTP